MKSRQQTRQDAREYVERRLTAHNYDDLADILKGASLHLNWAPSRSTFYEWVREWRESRSSDTSGKWSLATDKTGRPDILMRVLAELFRVSSGNADELTVGEAEWLVRLANAIPPTWPAVRWRQGLRDGSSQTVTEPGALHLLSWARRYLDAETQGNADELALYDWVVASEYWPAPLSGEPNDQKQED